MGINYTPILLVTFGVNYRQGEGGDNDTTFNVDMTYRLGVPWSNQVDPAIVDFSRTLAGAVTIMSNVIMMLYWITKSRL